MKDSQHIDGADDAPQSANAVSVFGSVGGLGDFPVLKAFQEYVDAEQAKARKRMLGLSVFFILLLVVVVVTFTLVMTTIINRNQALSDRLLDIALRDRSPSQPVVNVQSPVPQPIVQPQPQPESMKPVLERFDKLADALDKVRLQQQSAPVAAAAQEAAAQAEVARLREALNREKEARKAEAAKAREEKRQAEVEAHRRRLYPEYYGTKAASPATAAKPPLSPPPPSRQAQPQSRLQSMKPISYFNAEDDEELAKLLSTAKPKQQPAPLPAAAPVQKPAAPKAAVAPAKKQEMLSIGGQNGSNAIPWFITGETTK